MRLGQPPRGVHSEQYLRHMKVHRVNVLSAPGRDVPEYLLGYGLPPLLLPQPAQTHNGSQIAGCGLLTAGDSKELVETGCRLCCWGIVGQWMAN